MKKKISLLTAVLGLAFAANVMAAPTASGTGSVAGWVSQTGGVIKLGAGSGTPATPRLDLKPSANVVIYYTVNATGTVYVAGSYHTSGSYAYGTSSLDTNIFRTGFTTGTDPVMPTVATSTTGSIDWTGWTAAK